MYNGLVNVYKEPGFTSFDVCAVIRGITGQRKVGHTGTLDPAAEGVLPICLGNATKLCDMLEGKTKEYVATFLLGKSTDTLDITGTVLEEREPKVTETELVKAAESFVGGYDQVPPMYSAKKINGQKLYDLARQGKEVERKPVFVDIYEIEILEMNLPNVKMRVHCGKGTYIRSLCQDIAAKCGELGVMTSLTRTRVSNFEIGQALRIKDIEQLKNEGRLQEAILPTEKVFEGLEIVEVLPEFKRLIDNGNKMLLHMVKGIDNPEDGLKVRMYNCEKRFVGVFSYDGREEAYKPFKMFQE